MIDRTLVQMGGSKKRKRRESFHEENAEETEESSIQTFMPIIQNSNKRKSNECYDKMIPYRQNKKKLKKRKRNRGTNSNLSQNQNNCDSGYDQYEFQPFDYSSVDFNQFQGGAVENSGQKLFKSNFKPKVSYKFCFGLFVILFYFYRVKNEVVTKETNQQHLGLLKRGQNMDVKLSLFLLF